jgi:hypothetical protein
MLIQFLWCDHSPASWATIPRFPPGATIRRLPGALLFAFALVSYSARQGLKLDLPVVLVPDACSSTALIHQATKGGLMYRPYSQLGCV